MYRSISRRELITSAGTLCAATLLADSGASAQTSKPALYANTQPIIDTHQHLWDFRKFHPPWLLSEPKLNHSTTMSDYLKATEGLNVVKTVYMEVDVAPKQQLEEAEWVIDVCSKHNTLMAAGVVSCRPALPGFDEYANRFKGSPYIKGMRQVLQVPDAKKGLCLEPQFVKNIQLLGQLGLRFDICIRPEELSDGIKLADMCPKTRFVLDHCGNGAARNPHQKQWERDITEFGKRSNVVCKVSGVIKTVHPDWDAVRELDPIVKHVLQSFGPDRVMFGGDWPVCNDTSSFHGWVKTLRTIVRNENAQDLQKLFHDNAKRFYEL